MRTRHNKKRFVPTKPTANSTETNSLALRYFSLKPNTAESNDCLRALIGQLKKLVHYELVRTPTEEMGGLSPMEKEELTDYLLTLHLSAILRNFNPMRTTFTTYFRTALKRRLAELLYHTPSAFNVTGGVKYFNRRKWKNYRKPRMAKHIRRIQNQLSVEDLSSGQDGEEPSQYREHPALGIPENTRPQAEEKLQRDFFLRNLPLEAIPVVKAILDGVCTTKSEYEAMLRQHRIKKSTQAKIRTIIRHRTRLLNE